MKVLLFAAAICLTFAGCSTDSPGNANTKTEHDRDGEGHHREGNEESGKQFALDATCDETRHGIRLVLGYDKHDQAFLGTVENTTGTRRQSVRVEVHLSNGKELGPTTPGDLAPKQKRKIRLEAKSTDFKTWSAHPEVGHGEHEHR